MAAARRLLLAAAVAALAAAPGRAASDRELFAAARSGNLEEIERLLEAGVPATAADRYGTTALAMAAGAGHAEVVARLLERGADPDEAEDFYGTRPIDQALAGGHRGVLRVLLAAGAEGREAVLEQALTERDLEMARWAVESGPLVASRLAMARNRAGGMDREFRQLLAAAESRPDPPPPEYSIEELHELTGQFEGFESDTAVEVVLREGELVAWLDGERVGALEVIGERDFRSADGRVRLEFVGRAGTIEGFRLHRLGAFPELLRRSVAEPVTAAAPVGEPAPEAGTAAGPVAGTPVHWPGFRGPGATGIGDGAEAPTSWDLESGDGVAWVAELPGLGNSSPVVWGERIFVTTAVSDGAQPAIQTGLTGSGGRMDDEGEHGWRVLAFDKRSGEKLWETEVGRGLPLTRRHFKATQANSTPATDGEHLVAVFPTAGLACLGLDGAIHWHHDLGGLNAGAFTDPGVEWGFASSPFLWGSRVYMQVDIHEGPYLAAWDLESGEELWRVERDVAPSWATPNVLEGPEGPELVVNGSTIHAYDPETGRELWSLGPNSELVIATPVIGGDLAFVSAGYPPVKPIYAVRAGTRGELTVKPGREHERLAWSHSRGGAYMPTPLLYRGLLYVVHHNGRLVAYDAASGEARLKSRFSRGGTFTSSPVAVNGRIYTATEEGLVYVLEAGSEYRELAVNDMGEPVMATPAVSEGTLYIRTPSRLVALQRGAPPAD